MTRKTILFIFICCIMSFLCYGYAYADEYEPLYMIYPQDFEDAGYKFIKDNDNSAHIRNLSEEDIKKSIESGEGIWHDQVIGETGDVIDAYFVLFKDGKACVVKDREYVRGADGFAVNIIYGKYDYSLKAEFLVEDETYIVAGDDYMTEYYMPATVTPSYEEIKPLYFIKLEDAEVNGDVVKGTVSSVFTSAAGERTDGYFVTEEDGKYLIQTNVSAENRMLDIACNDDGICTVNATGEGEENIYMYSNDRSEKYMMTADIAEAPQEEIDGAFIRIIKAIIAIFKR